MRWDPRGTVALVVSAIVGIAAGVVVGLSSGTPGGSAADPGGGPSGSPSASSGSPDPLGLDIPLENLKCNGEKILVVGYGEQNDTGELLAAASSNPDAKYLETSKSCNTLYGEADEVTPTYVVYTGPYDTIKEPCVQQLSPRHARDSVTNLKPGTKIHVQCLCVLPPSTFPVLKPGAPATTKDGVYIRALQQVLADLDLLGDQHVTGLYDDRTAQVIEDQQNLNAISVNPPGKVDKQTWEIVRDRGCVNYDF